MHAKSYFVPTIIIEEQYRAAFVVELSDSEIFNYLLEREFMIVKLHCKNRIVK